MWVYMWMTLFILVIATTLRVSLKNCFAENLLDSLGYSSDTVSTFTTPYGFGLSINSIPTQPKSVTDCDQLRLQYQSLVGSLNWLGHTTCPDISTVVSLLAQHQSNPS
jgi:hypothetical protein